MKLNTVSLTFGGTVPMGQYANIKIEVNVTATVEEGETLQEVVQALGDQARKEVAELTRPMVVEKARVLTEINTFPKNVQSRLAAILPALVWLQAVEGKVENDANQGID